MAVESLNWLDRYFTPPLWAGEDSKPLPMRPMIRITGKGAKLTDDPIEGRTELVIDGGGAGLPWGIFAVGRGSTGSDVLAGRKRVLGFWPSLTLLSPVVPAAYGLIVTAAFRQVVTADAAVRTAQWGGFVEAFCASAGGVACSETIVVKDLELNVQGVLFSSSEVEGQELLGARCWAEYGYLAVVNSWVVPFAELPKKDEFAAALRRMGKGVV